MQIGCWSLNYNTVFIPLNEWFFSYIPDSFLICITYCRFIFIFICSRFNFNFLKLFLHKARNTFVQWNGCQTLLARSLCFTRSRNEPGLFQITARRLISAPEAASVVNQIPVTQVITSNRTSGNGRACIACWRLWAWWRERKREACHASTTDRWSFFLHGPHMWHCPYPPRTMAYISSSFFPPQISVLEAHGK